MPKTVLAGYVPVLHRGYLELFKAHPDATELHVFGPDLLGHEDYLRKELRAIAPADMVEVLGAGNRFKHVKLLTTATIKGIDKSGTRIILPDEDISRTIAETYLKKAKVAFYPIFLRWDRRTVEGVDEAITDIEISKDELDRRIMGEAYRASTKSPDIWRHVGAIIARGGTAESVAFNRPMTTDQTLWAEGDPRGIFSRGVGIELSTVAHAEARLIAAAARDGRSLVGTALYATTFPCPPCAALIAGSGVKTLYYEDGYAVLDGRRVLEEAGIQLIKVDMGPDFVIPDDERAWVPYPKSK